jgi:hypothetical protein
MISGQRQSLAALPPEKRPGTHRTGGWVGLRAGLNACRKSRSHRNSNRTVQPVASRYADWAIPAHPTEVITIKFYYEYFERYS